MIAQPCDQCLPAMIQGVYCHERGCPNTGNPPPGVCLECMSYVDEQGHLPSCSDWYPTGLPEFFDPSDPGISRDLAPDLGDVLQPPSDSQGDA